MCQQDGWPIVLCCRPLFPKRSVLKASSSLQMGELSERKSAPSRLVGDIRIHVGKDVIDAALCGPVLGVAMPRAIANRSAPNFGHLEALPTDRQSLLVPAGELERQHLLGAVLVAEDVWADLALRATIGEDHLLAFEDRPVKESKRLAMAAPHDFEGLISISAIPVCRKVSIKARHLLYA